MKFVPMLTAAAAVTALMAAAATASLAQDSAPPAPAEAPPAATPAATPPVEPPPEFAVCTACHETTEGGVSLGPNLANIGGRKAGIQPGYDYSEAMHASGVTWDPATLQAFILDPAKAMPGNKMDYPGTGNAEAAKAIADYLMTLKG